MLRLLDHLLSLRDPGVHVVPRKAKVPVGAVDVVSAPNQHEVVARFAFIRELDSSAVNAIDEGLKILPPNACPLPCSRCKTWIWRTPPGGGQDRCTLP